MSGEEDTPATQSTSEINLNPESQGIIVHEPVAIPDDLTFSEYSLDQTIVDAIAALGWTKPTPVQALCLPYTLKGRDVAGFAQTGTGKTGVFLITATHRLLKRDDRSQPGCIVIVPTRELAVQIEQDAEGLLQSLGLKSLAVFGGIDYAKQASKLREGIDIVVATPGRLKDYHQKKIIDLKKCELFVCDEADRMFDMGFLEDVEYFLERLAEDCQKLLFSATTNAQVKELAFEYLETPEYISVNPETITPESITQYAIHVNSRNKLKVMMGLLKDHNPECAIIFTNTKLTAEWLHYKLENNGVDVELITGDLPQKRRIRLIQKIKEGTIKALIATDVASRGLHISRVTHVYNFDIPDEAANYVHRIGRTARAGATGSAYSLVCEDYGHNMVDVNKLLGEQVAMESQWFDEKYLEIVDKAGDPFANRSFSRAGASADDRPAPRGRDSGPRGRDDGNRPEGRSDRGRPRHQEGESRDGGPRDGGPRDGGRRRGQGGRDGGPRRDQRQDRNGQDRQGQDRQGGGGDRQGRPQGGGRGGQRSDKSRRPGERRPDRQAATGQNQPAQKQAAQHGATPAKQSVGGVIKKMFKALFGRKD